MDSNNQFKCNNYKIFNSIINREDIRTNEPAAHPMGYISCVPDPANAKANEHGGARPPHPPRTPRTPRTMTTRTMRKGKGK